MGCAATTTREALWVCEDFEGDDFGCGHADHDEQHEKVCAALASLEQLVEAAWRVLYLVDIGDGSDSVTEADDALRAALAAVGPGEETAE